MLLHYSSTDVLLPPPRWAEASAPRQLLLHCSTYGRPALMLTPLTYIHVGIKKPGPVLPDPAFLQVKAETLIHVIQSFLETICM